MPPRPLQVTCGRLGIDCQESAGLDPVGSPSHHLCGWLGINCWESTYLGTSSNVKWCVTLAVNHTMFCPLHNAPLLMVSLALLFVCPLIMFHLNGELNDPLFFLCLVCSWCRSTDNVFLTCIYVLIMDQITKWMLGFPGCRPTDVVRYGCWTCDKRYVYMGSLNRHYRKFPNHDPGQYYFETFFFTIQFCVICRIFHSIFCQFIMCKWLEIKDRI